MNRYILKIGMIFLFSTAGLSGCIFEETNDEKNPVESIFISFEELDENLDMYLGENITMKGYISEGLGDNIGSSYVTNLCSSNLTNPKYCVFLNVPTNVTIYKGKYRITGFVGMHPNVSIPMINVTSAKLL